MENIRCTYLRPLQGCLGDLTYELRIQYHSVAQEQTWRPAINAYCCRDQIMVCVELAGVDREKIGLQAEPHRLLIRGLRQPLDPTVDEGPPLQILALEIDQGVFQREIPMPLEIDPARVRAEQRNGLLWIYLPLAQ